MRFYTVDLNGNEYAAVENTDKKLVTLDSIGIKVSDMNEFIKRFDELKADIENGIKSGRPIDDYRILAPIPVPLQDIICLGVNYKEHIDETVDVHDFTNKQDAVYFSKRVNRCNDPDGIIPAYDFVDCLDYEAELGVVLKKDAFRVSAEEASDYIFGYTIINDVSARDLQFKHQQWYRGKSLDGYTPMGPCIVTKDGISDAHDLSIECFVNDEKRQSSNTSRMITTVEEAISELSQGMTLKAGTVIATGTPGGVGMGFKPPKYLQPGDIVKCSIKGIGELVSKVGKSAS